MLVNIYMSVIITESSVEARKGIREKVEMFRMTMGLQVMLKMQTLWDIAVQLRVCYGYNQSQGT